jgi:hypothetical protein
MAHRSLKTKPADQVLLDRLLFTLPELKENRRRHEDLSAHRPARRWRWPPVVLSLVFHGAMVLLCWFHPARDRGLFGIDSRVAESLREETEPAVDFFLVGRAPAPRPQPAPVTSQPVAPPTPSSPVVVPSRTETPVRNTAPLNPLFNQRLAQREPDRGSQSGNEEPGGQPTGAGTGATSFFQIATRGLRIVYVIDRSSSMGETGALALAKRELRASLDILVPEARFQIIAYNRSAEPLRVNGQSGLLPATPDNKHQAVWLIDHIHAEGGTEHLTALRRALQFQPDVLFFLTDADALTEEQVRTITRLNQGRTVIHAFEMGVSHLTDALSPLQLLARDNRGEYRRVKQALVNSEAPSGSVEFRRD